MPKKPNKKRQRAKKREEAKAEQEQDDLEMDEEEQQAPLPPSVWQPGADAIAEGETLQYDPTAYDCLHQLTFEWPCLSFDIVKDGLGGPRRAFPHSMMLVAGTQAATARANYLALMRLSNLGQGEQAKAADEEEDDFDLDDSESDDDEKAHLHTIKVPADCGFNRVRSMPQRPSVVAVWCENGKVQVWDLSTQMQRLTDIAEDATDSQTRQHVSPAASHAHRDEGFALDWSCVTAGRLASGDCQANIHVWEAHDGGTFTVSAPFRHHTASVEDVQWSPTEATVFASASVDQSIRIWDTRDRSKSQITVAAHDADVNVISWNAVTPHTMASGGDDHRLRVWDLRALKHPVADFNWHKGPITSVEWSPHESAMLLTTGADNALGVWDLALERDPEEEMQLGLPTNATAPSDLPAQLLFVHAGQQDMKEAHWHQQIPGMLISTAADGVHVFKPSNILESNA